MQAMKTLPQVVFLALSNLRTTPVDSEAVVADTVLWNAEQFKAEGTLTKGDLEYACKHLTGAFSSNEARDYFLNCINVIKRTLAAGVPSDVVKLIDSAVSKLRIASSDTEMLVAGQLLKSLRDFISKGEVIPEELSYARNNVAKHITNDIDRRFVIDSLEGMEEEVRQLSAELEIRVSGATAEQLNNLVQVLRNDQAKGKYKLTISGHPEVSAPVWDTTQNYDGLLIGEIHIHQGTGPNGIVLKNNPLTSSDVASIVEFINSGASAPIPPLVVLSEAVLRMTDEDLADTMVNLTNVEAVALLLGNAAGQNAFKNIVASVSAFYAHTDAELGRRMLAEAKNLVCQQIDVSKSFAKAYLDHYRAKKA